MLGSLGMGPKSLNPKVLKPQNPEPQPVLHGFGGVDAGQGNETAVLCCALPELGKHGAGSRTSVFQAHSRGD